VDFSSLPAPMKDVTPPREAQKKMFGGEFIPANFIAKPGAPPEPYLTFFQHDRNDNPKGIVALDLDTLP